MKAARPWLIVATLALAWNAPVGAQERPATEAEPEVDTQKPADMPRGPAEIFKRNQERPKAPAGPTAPELPPGMQPPAVEAVPEAPTAHGAGAEPSTPEAPPAEPTPAAPAPAGTAQPPVGNDPHAGMDAPALARRSIATAEPNAAVPVGSILVRVVDATTEKPVPNAQVQLGTMTRENTRKTQDAKTAASGVHVFEKLATGDGQAYRINVMHDGAKYSSTPFRLPYDTGYDVLIRQLPTTRDARELVLYVGATSVELRDERLKVVQQARLVNIGAKTYVFPDDGTLLKLPPGFTAFQTEEVMTDQRLKEAEGGIAINGSIPPGETTLTWGFDLPYSTTEVDMTFELPWVTFAYRVISDAPPGMTLSVAGLPEPIVHDENGRRLLLTEIQLKVGDARLTELRIDLRGIPGPGPGRWIAAALALLLVIGGVVLGSRSTPKADRSAERERADDDEARKRELLARARELQEQRARDEIGPQFHAEQLELVRDELAALLLAGSERSAQR